MDGTGTLNHVGQPQEGLTEARENPEELDRLLKKSRSLPSSYVAHCAQYWVCEECGEETPSDSDMCYCCGSWK